MFSQFGKQIFFKWPKDEWRKSLEFIELAVKTNPFNLTNGFESRQMQLQLMTMNLWYKLPLDDQVRYCNLLQPHLLKPSF